MAEGDRYHYHEEPDGPKQYQFDEETAETLREMARNYEHGQWLRLRTKHFWKTIGLTTGTLVLLKQVYDWIIQHVRISP